MAANPQNRELRLFVSSTFRDLQPEREELVKKTFPRIRKECRDRGVEFTEIDLRWGITEEESRSGRTIRICLEEIDRCRPYFIGILGSRYGWVPGMTEIAKDAELLKEFPWLAEYGSEQRSIIEMEFAHGAIQKKNDSAFFYEQQLETREEGLSPLTEKIMAAGLPVRHFTSPEKLGEQVFSDIVAILDRDFPKRELTPLERERIEHEAYARNRIQSYVANPEYYKAFEKHVNSDGPPLIIWGKSGLGKSALMAHLAHEYREHHPDAFIIQHFIGAAEGSDPEDVMRQVMMEIKERYQLADTVPTDDNTLREEFPVWLAKIHDGDKLVLLIDALNQLTGIAPEMHWMPEFIPPNVRLVLSTTADSLPLEELRKRNWNELELQPLTERQREKISSDFLKRFHKSLTKADLHMLASNAKASSPLFLRTVLEELRIFGSHSALHDELEEYLASADERELFQKVLERMERDHGEEDVRSVMTAIWASRHGLSESELMEITGFTRMTLSILMTALEYHLMKREEFHTFFHNYLREAIELRYLPGDEGKKAAHARLGKYFETREFAHRRWVEEPWQWQEAGDTAELKRSLLAPELLAMLETSHEQYEALTYWRQCGGVGIDASYAARLADSGLDEEIVFKAFLNAVELLVLASDYAQADQFFSSGFPLFDTFHLDDERWLHLKEKQMGILASRGHYTQAIEEINAILRDPRINQFPKERLTLLEFLCFSYHGEGRLAEAEEAIRECIEETKIIFGPQSEEIISRFDSLASLLVFQNKLEEAENYFRLIIEIVSDRYGATHTKMARALMQLASLFIRMGRFQKALDLLTTAEEIFLKTVGPDHLETNICRQQMARALGELKNYATARDIFIRVTGSLEKRYGLERKTTASCGMSIGWTYYMEGNYEAAISCYEKYLPYYEITHGADNPETIIRRNRLSEMKAKLSEQGNEVGNG